MSEFVEGFISALRFIQTIHIDPHFLGKFLGFFLVSITFTGGSCFLLHKAFQVRGNRNRRKLPPIKELT